jgi:hypothetical protein
MVLTTTPQVTFKCGADFERTEFNSASRDADRFVCLFSCGHTLEVFSEVKAARSSCVSRATMCGGRSISAKATVELTRRPLLFITQLSGHRRHGRTSCWLDPVAIDPGCVKTSPSRERAELFSLSSSPNSGRKHLAFKLTKSRRDFYTQIGRRSFRATKTRSGQWTPVQSSLLAHRSGVVLDFRSV